MYIYDKIKFIKFLKRSRIWLNVFLGYDFDTFRKINTFISLKSVYLHLPKSFTCSYYV